ncbi:MAG: hypothetical protein ABI193_04840 [Minicystis sp.]
MTTSKTALGLVGLLGLWGCGGTDTIDPIDPIDPADAGPAVVCKPEAAQGVEVSATDVYGGAPYALGYPPYAIDGCRLVYVARSASGAGSGELRLRDLATGKERVLAPELDEPRRPSVAGSIIVWEATSVGKSVLRVQGPNGVQTIAGSFDHASEPRAAEDAVVFTAWLGPGKDADTDVLLFDPASAKLTSLGAGKGQQRFADISKTHVAWADFIEDPDGRFDENESDIADVVVFDRATGVATTRHREGKQAFPMLGAEGKIATLDWNLVHPEPKLSAYELRIGDLGAPVEDDVLVEHVETLQPYVRPVARGALLEWVAWPEGSATLFRRAADLSTPAEKLPGLEGLSLFAPTASAAITLVGARASGGPMVIQAFAR